MACSNSSWNTFFDELDCDSCAEEAVQLFPDLILTPNGRKHPLQQDFWSSNWGVLPS
jgi:hypothetical protein